MDEATAYNLWPLVVINSLVFIVFAFSFTRPKTKTDWRALSGFGAFIVALFTEMYGFPLSVYLLSGWLTSKYPGMSLQSHTMGHLWETIFGWKGDPHLNLLQWPTIPTLVMFPILLVVYRRLAIYEQRTMVNEFGGAYTNYAQKVPAFIPRLHTKGSGQLS